MNFRTDPTLSLIAPQIDKAITAMHRKLAENLASAQLKEDENELTEDEKFAICYAAGVRTETVPNERMVFHMRAVPCAVRKIDGKWCVFQREPSFSP